MHVDFYNFHIQNDLDHHTSKEFSNNKNDKKGIEL